MGMNRGLGVALAVLSLAAGCSSDPLGPEDPGYDEECTVYVTDGEYAEIPTSLWKRCEPVRIVVLRFDGTVLHSYERSSP